MAPAEVLVAVDKVIFYPVREPFDTRRRFTKPIRRALPGVSCDRLGLGDRRHMALLDVGPYGKDNAVDTEDAEEDVV